MPEIAEVETVRRTLKKRVLHKLIKRVDVIYKGTIESDLELFKKNLVNESFIDIKRIGKYLIFETDKYYLLSHLRMEGKYFLKNENEPLVKHEHVVITFNDGSDMRYHDTRKFGKMNLILKEELNSVPGIKKQGFEPFSKELTAEYLVDKFKRNIPIKSLLLDQTIISGLGNIYADEVLYYAKVLPTKLGSELSTDECSKIVLGTNEIIKDAMEMGGTTIKSYTSSLGVTGLFQQKLMAHQRVGEPCKICGTLISKIKVGGRGTYFCPECQK